MTEIVNDREDALNLMVRALALLDKIDESHAAMDLQQAIDTLIGADEPQTAEEIDTVFETFAVQRILKRMDSRARPAKHKA